MKADPPAPGIAGQESASRRILDRVLRSVVLVAIVGLCPALSQAQFEPEPGHSIGTVTTRGNLILLTLINGALGGANMFNLAHHTLRFIPVDGGYRVQTLPFAWDADFGLPLATPQVDLKNFAFPFSGKTWTTLSVGITGSIVFGKPESTEGQAGLRGISVGRDGGLSVERFAELQEAASEMVNTVPAISVFFKPRMSGTRYFKELEDRAVISWSVTEAFAGIQDWSWTPTVNRFQAVLHKNGTIDLSWQDVAARDAIVGIYPLVTGGQETSLASISIAGDSSRPAHVDIRKLSLTSLSDLYLKVSLEARGPMLAETDPAIAGLTYVELATHDVLLVRISAPR